jgi:hypothetical protein
MLCPARAQPNWPTLAPAMNAVHSSLENDTTTSGSDEFRTRKRPSTSATSTQALLEHWELRCHVGCCFGWIIVPPP